MKQKTFDKLLEAYTICDSEDRSIEYTIEFLKDYANVSHDCVMFFLFKLSKKDRNV